MINMFGINIQTLSNGVRVATSRLYSVVTENVKQSLKLMDDFNMHKLLACTHLKLLVETVHHQQDILILKTNYVNKTSKSKIQNQHNNNNLTKHQQQQKLYCSKVIKKYMLNLKNL